MKKGFPISIILLALILFLLPAHKVIKDQSPDDETIERIKWVDSVFQSLSAKERIGQLLMVAAYSNENADPSKIIKSINRHGIGGIMFLQGGPKRQLRLTNQYQEKSEVPLLIALDAEWGLGMRLDSTISYPRQMMLGAIQDPELIYSMGADIARQLKRIGVHINFAPVIDINNNPENPVINSRSFGEIRENVVRLGSAYMNGLQENGIMATAKHFPGHGDTHHDSHKTLPTINHSVERLDSLELFPFEKLIQQGIGGIMVAHLHITSLDSASNRASTLSPAIVDTLLKKKLQFNGLVFTDALNMKGVSNYYSPGELEVKALQAGNDILLMPDNVEKAIKAIKKAIDEGTLSQSIIDNRCKKVLMAKYNAGLNEYQPAEKDSLMPFLRNPFSEYKVKELTGAALTVVKNENDLIPVKPIDQSIACITFNAPEPHTFEKSINRYAPIKTFRLNDENLSNKMNACMQQLDKYQLVILHVDNTHQSPYKRFGINEEVIKWVEKISREHPTILNLAANPYSLSFFNTKDLKSIIIGYNDSPASRDLSGQLIFGGISAKGKLPVSTRQYPAGTGIKTPKTRLKYSQPEAFGVQSSDLDTIDRIVRHAITEEAMPGCQIIAIKSGEIIYDKNFGHHTYLEKKSVRDTNLYDIASLTKIFATLPALMKLYESGKLDIDQTLGHYLPTINETNKKDLVLKEILAHQAGLKAWIPFYYKAFTLLKKNDQLINNELSAAYPFKVGKHTFLNRNYTFRNNFFRHQPEGNFKIEVAKDIYMNADYIDTLYQSINQSDLNKKKEYKYSDLGYYYFTRIIESLIRDSFQIYLDKNFYRPLGMTHTSYLPLQKYPDSIIIPTENDRVFRNQVLRGYVHDPGAAMLGGVAGHAGLFSNAHDLAIFMQTLVNKGVYGGVRFFKPETIDYFTKCHFCEKNRRGLGFDKPEPDRNKPGPTCHCTSLQSFGHSGFTGCYVWADPESQIIYIFLSNRIHPNGYNRKLIEMDIRTKIQKEIHRLFDPGFEQRISEKNKEE